LSCRRRLGADAMTSERAQFRPNSSLHKPRPLPLTVGGTQEEFRSQARWENSSAPGEEPIPAVRRHWQETNMKRVLITGMSGTGKSAVVRELAARGYPAVDLDTPEWSEWVDADPADALTPRDGKDWLWREDPVRKLLSEHQSGRLFTSGCAENMNRFFTLIELIVLLSAPMEVIKKRLEARSPDG
jgi:hypothetical protein